MMRAMLRKFFICLTLVQLYPLFLFSQSNAVDSFINASAIREIVEFLTADSLKGRMTASPGAKRAANYIAEEFRKAGARPPRGFNDYFIPFQIKPLPLTDNNVIGILQGTDTTELIIFSAHYDHVGTVFSNPYEQTRKADRYNLPDSIYNGANDNASGTAVLISLARYFGHLKNNKRTILFVGFSGEELGLVGSKALAEAMANPEMVICHINFDMVGRGGHPFITGSELGNLRELLNKELARVDQKRYKRQYFKADSYRDQNLFARSDNFPFAQLKIPAHTIMTTSGDDYYYHTVYDEPSTLNYRLIQNLTRAVALGMAPILDGTSTPKRINAAGYGPIEIKR